MFVEITCSLAGIEKKADQIILMISVFYYNDHVNYTVCDNDIGFKYFWFPNISEQ